MEKSERIKESLLSQNGQGRHPLGTSSINSRTYFNNPNTMSLLTKELAIPPAPKAISKAVRRHSADGAQLSNFSSYGYGSIGASEDIYVDEAGHVELSSMHPNESFRNARRNPTSEHVAGSLDSSFPYLDEFGRAGTFFNESTLNSFNRLGQGNGSHHLGGGNKTIRSSRARKKTAARSKGGEFQARRRKRRLYFCCIGSEIDVEKLADYFQECKYGMKGHMYDEVLHLYMDNPDILHIPQHEMNLQLNIQHELRRPRSDTETNLEIEHEQSSSLPDNDLLLSNQLKASNIDLLAGETIQRAPSFNDAMPGTAEESSHEDIRSTAAFWNYGGKEVFIFDFGAIVFWGYHRSEVTELLELARAHVVKGKLSDAEFEAGEDDMAFVTTVDEEAITIANDVIFLPDRTSVKSRLAVSFAIAQSSVLSIFEARIEEKIEEYKFIPETFAKSGHVQLTPKQLGNMIGEVFVIRHDVNLHSEILDIPDYFWKENQIEPLYKMTAMYLEMEPRTEVLNKRLDLLRELLRMLQHQHENAHNVKLEWIIIWLIVVSVILELGVMVGEMLHP